MFNAPRFTKPKIRRTAERVLFLCLGITALILIVNFNFKINPNPNTDCDEFLAGNDGSFEENPISAAPSVNFPKVSPTLEELAALTDDRMWDAPTANSSGAKRVVAKTFGPSDLVYGHNVSVMNDTVYSLDIPAMLSSPSKLYPESSGYPQVLIIHTHATEGYLPERFDYYLPEFVNRESDTRYNTVRAGDLLAARLEELGLTVLHDRELYDSPSIIGAYGRSLESVEQYIAQYPSIQLVIDLHRDGISDKQGIMYAPISQTQRGTAAQIMFVIGSNGSEPEYTGWLGNLTLALQLQDTVSQKYPDLMRSVHFREERLNQHVTPSSLILEVGSSVSTLDEALLSVELFCETAGSEIAKRILAD